MKKPLISDSASDRDSLEQQSIKSPIQEGFPLISQVVPYPVDIQETPIQVQAPLGSPLVGLPFPNLNNFRDFDQNIRTVATFSLDQMAVGNASQSIPPVVNSVTDMARSSAMAQHPMPTTAQQPRPKATL